MSRQWRTTWRLGMADDPDLAEESITAAYVAMHSLPWDADDERKTLLSQNEFQIALVERLLEAQAKEPQLRIEILDRLSEDVVASRCCVDLEHAVDTYLRFQTAVLLASIPIAQNSNEFR